MSGLKQKAYQLIKEQILNGKLQQGSVVSISAIARQLNISRTPVTYACLKLEHDRFVTIMPKQGVLINSISVVDAKEIYELRVAVEQYCALRIFGSIPENIRNRLHESYVKQTECIGKGDIDGFMKEDLLFHRLFLSVLQNSQFLRLFDSIQEKAHQLGMESLKSPKRQQENLIEHKEILNAMDGDDKYVFAKAIETNILKGLAFFTGGEYF
jgi:DNA-binding GntR family transcriptional regulator